MKYIKKNDIKSGIIIIVVSTIIALLYNVIRGDNCCGTIPFFKAAKENLVVGDDELFGNTTLNDAEQQINDNLDTPIDTTFAKTTNNIDTIKSTIDTANVNKLDYAALLKEAKKSSSANYSIITKEQMKKIVADNSANFIIVDARRSEDYKEARIGNAINIFPYDDESIVIEKVQTLPMSKTIIVYCDGGGCESSHLLGNILNMFGYKFFIYEGGWEEWNK